MRSKAGMSNKQGGVDLRFAQVSAPLRTLAWLGLAGAHISFQSHLMEVRRNSPPERTEPYMTGTVVDSYVRGGQRSVDIGPDTSSEICSERRITNRTQRLQDDMENLKDHLRRYINLRSIQKWTPQDTLTTFCLLLDLNLLQHGHAGQSCLYQNLWPKLASFLGYVRTLFYATFNTNTNSIVIFLLISHFSLQGVGMIVHAFTVG